MNCLHGHLWMVSGVTTAGQWVIKCGACGVTHQGTRNVTWTSNGSVQKN